MRLIKRLVYWAGMLFILTALAFEVQLFLEQYPDLGLHGSQGVNTWLELARKPWSTGILLACAICAFGSYLVMALENFRLRRKLNAKKPEPEA